MFRFLLAAWSSNSARNIHDPFCSNIYLESKSAFRGSFFLPRGFMKTCLNFETLRLVSNTFQHKNQKDRESDCPFVWNQLFFRNIEHVLK